MRLLPGRLAPGVGEHCALDARVLAGLRVRVDAGAGVALHLLVTGFEPDDAVARAVVVRETDDPRAVLRDLELRSAGVDVESQDFYELMQAYRRADHLTAAARFEDVKAWVRARSR